MINANLTDLVYSRDLVKEELANIELSHHYVRSGNNDNDHETIEMTSNNNRVNTVNGTFETIDEKDIMDDNNVSEMDPNINAHIETRNNVFSQTKEEEFIVEQFDDITENKCKKMTKNGLNKLNQIRNLSCFGNNTNKLLACSNLFAIASMVLLLCMWILFW